ncbi:hypothetical protein [Streptomyces sp. NPDC059783]|uniref:hypothetical protein n=1 Tax=Streptomyces sp. NPDC059783 TaxID=3346944 RepID=UPI0036575BAD
MNTGNTLDHVLSGLRLPEGTYAKVLHDLTGSPQEREAQIVVWTDRPYAVCPRCDQPVTHDLSQAAPVQLRQGELEPFDQQHSCGLRLAVLWEGVRGTDDHHAVTPDDVLCVARELSEALTATRQSRRDTILSRLREELTEALQRLNEPLAEGETLEERAEDVRTGSETAPGIYLEDGHWIIWAYDPGRPGGSEDDLVVVHETELQLATHP